jgi:hypothetical protein
MLSVGKMHSSLLLKQVAYTTVTTGFKILMQDCIKSVPEASNSCGIYIPKQGDEWEKESVA